MFSALLSLPIFAQTLKRTPLDVTHYLMDVTLVPEERRLNATVDVTFTPLEDTRSVSFELNGSLKVESITRVGGTSIAPAPANAKAATSPKTPVRPAAVSAVTFIQDPTNSSSLGPHVRVELGDDVVKGTPVTLRFKYSGILDTPAGGPLLTKRLAHVGENSGYLMYAARWFPFNDYAADPASVPGDWRQFFSALANGQLQAEGTRRSQKQPASTGGVDGKPISADGGAAARQERVRQDPETRKEVEDHRELESQPECEQHRADEADVVGEPEEGLNVGQREIEQEGRKIHLGHQAFKVILHPRLHLLKQDDADLSPLAQGLKKEIRAALAA